MVPFAHIFRVSGKSGKKAKGIKTFFLFLFIFCISASIHDFPFPPINIKIISIHVSVYSEPFICCACFRAKFSIFRHSHSSGPFWCVHGIKRHNDVRCFPTPQRNFAVSFCFAPNASLSYQQLEWTGKGVLGSWIELIFNMFFFSFVQVFVVRQKRWLRGSRWGR